METRGDGLSAGRGAGWRRGGQGRDEGLELVWRHRGDGYFLQFTWHPNRPSRALQGISARAMASICVHRAPRTPPDSPPGHIPVPGGTKLCSPGPYSGANCLIINDGRCQVNFTKARFDSIRPEAPRSSLLCFGLSLCRFCSDSTTRLVVFSLNPCGLTGLFPIICTNLTQIIIFVVYLYGVTKEK